MRAHGRVRGLDGGMECEDISTCGAKYDHGLYAGFHCVRRQLRLYYIPTIALAERTAFCVCDEDICSREHVPNPHTVMLRVAQPATQCEYRGVRGGGSRT